jgi:hypothetical protein
MDISMIDKLIEGHQYIAIHDIDTPLVWIEFKKINHSEIAVSLIDADAKDGTGAIITETIPGMRYTDWAHEIILYEDIVNEVINTTKEYVNEVWTKNSKLKEAKGLIDLNKRCIATEMKVKH